MKKSLCINIAIKWKRLHSFRKISFFHHSSCWEQCCIQPYAWLLLSNTQFFSSSLLFSNLNSWGWSLLLLTVSHPLIWWLQLWFGELGLQWTLSWPFPFIQPAVFVSNLLAKWASLKWVFADHSSLPGVSSADVSLGLPTLLQPCLTLHYSAFLFLHVWIYLIVWSVFWLTHLSTNKIVKPLYVSAT